MSKVPSGLKYVSSHEWLRLNDSGEITVGITDYAQESLGELVFVELPSVGAKFSSGNQVCVIESVKAASDIYCPISGVIVSINEKLSSKPELVNSSPYDEGWFFRIKPDNISDYDSLLSDFEYQDEIS